LGTATIIKNYIKTWEGRGYPDGIPDEAPSVLEQLNKVPSYKRICFAILNNDLTILGITLPKSKYYNILKGIELKVRNEKVS
jgi:predicted phosphoadenosine phosphosulfate sulfurtransferase